MSEKEFLTAIAEDPLNRVLHLHYADYLQEHGDEWFEPWRSGDFCGFMRWGPLYHPGGAASDLDSPGPQWEWAPTATGCKKPHQIPVKVWNYTRRYIQRTQKKSVRPSNWFLDRETAIAAANYGFSYGWCWGWVASADDRYTADE